MLPARTSKELPEAIRNLRCALKLTRKEFAVKVKIAYKTIIRYEGTVDTPSHKPSENMYNKLNEAIIELYANHNPNVIQFPIKFNSDPNIKTRWVPVPPHPPEFYRYH